jgi:hypothetical protein
MVNISTPADLRSTAPTFIFFPHHCMALRLPHSNSSWVSCHWCLGTVLVIFAVLALTAIIHWLPPYIRKTISTEKELLPRVTRNDPISGFYGPGAWWAWLITLGMTHAHAARAPLNRDVRKD